MSNRLRKADRKQHSVEELAMKYLTARYRTEWRTIRSQMRRTFGRKATEQAIEDVAQGLKLCDPNFKRPAYR